MAKLFDYIFPTGGLRNIKIYYLLGVFTNGWFVMGNWTFYWLNYMNKFELSILDTFAFMIGFILEIPSGAIADLLGKKKTIILGLAIELIGTAIMAFGQTISLLGLGNSLAFAGLAFISGSMEALSYDSLVETKKESLFSKITSSYYALTGLVFVIVSLVGGMLYRIDPQYPWFGWAIFVGIALIISLFLTEPSVDTDKFSFSQFKKHTIIGFKNLFSINLKPVILLIIASWGVYRLWGQGFIRQYVGESFGYTGETLSYTYAIINAISLISLYFFTSIRNYFKDVRGINILYIGQILILSLLFITTNYYIGFFIMLFITLLGRFVVPWASVVVNENLESKYRASTISTLAMLTQTPYIIFGIIGGYLAEINKLQTFYFILVAILIAIFALNKYINLKRS